VSVRTTRKKEKEKNKEEEEEEEEKEKIGTNFQLRRTLVSCPNVLSYE
jgi:hypothetical protein